MHPKLPSAAMDADKFLDIIDHVPLVSIDLVVENPCGEVLLGQRMNRPARGYWFVPGGRIRKNETLHDAMARISQVELGMGLAIEDARLLGAYDHLYDDNFQGREGIGTHYVALGFHVRLAEVVAVDFDTQHAEMRWWPVDALLASDEVHQNTKNYFVGR